MIEGWVAGRLARVAGTAPGMVAEAVLRSEDGDLGLEQGVGLVKCAAELSLGARSGPSSAVGACHRRTRQARYPLVAEKLRVGGAKPHGGGAPVAYAG